MKSSGKTQKQLVAENEDLRARLDEAEEILHAIRNGEVDALIVSGADGEQISHSRKPKKPCASNPLCWMSRTHWPLHSNLSRT